GIHKVLRELGAHVIDDALAGAVAEGFGFEAVEFFLLAHVGGVADHFAVVLLLKPFEDDGGVESTGIGENDFHGVFFSWVISWACHSAQALSMMCTACLIWAAVTVSGGNMRMTLPEVQTVRSPRLARICSSSLAGRSMTR